MQCATESMFNFGNNPASKNEKHEVKIQKAADIFKRTLNPLTTTTTVLGVVFNGGVAVAADVGGYYGSMARFRNLERISKVNDSIILAAGGDFADFQHLKDIVDQKIISEQILDDGFSLSPEALYTWITRHFYNLRSKFNPLWVNVMIAGWQDDTPFLGMVDKLGLAYVDKCIAAGFGSYMATPLLRHALEEAGEAGLTEEGAKEALLKCIQVLYYRDTRSYPKYRLATVTKSGVNVSEVKDIESNWDIAAYVRHFE